MSRLWATAANVWKFGSAAPSMSSAWFNAFLAWEVATASSPSGRSAPGSGSSEDSGVLCFQYSRSGQDTPRPRLLDDLVNDTGRAMSQENVEAVERAVAAVNERDIDRYLAGCTEDVELQTPLAPIGGAYEGVDAIRRFFADIEDTSPDFRLDLERVEAIGPDRVLALLRATASARASGIAMAAGLPTANVYDFVDGKIRRIRIFFDRQEALEAVGLREAERDALPDQLRSGREPPDSGDAGVGPVTKS